MGKVDDQRAMREAKYAARQRGAAGSAPAAPARAATARPAPTAAPTASPAPSASTLAGSTPSADDELCGHRSIGNKSCTREKGHQANGTKNHRYA